jgi:hypothetical protein
MPNFAAGSAFVNFKLRDSNIRWNLVTRVGFSIVGTSRHPLGGGADPEEQSRRAAAGTVFPSVCGPSPVSTVATLGFDLDAPPNAPECLFDRKASSPGHRGNPRPKEYHAN